MTQIDQPPPAPALPKPLALNGGAFNCPCCGWAVSAESFLCSNPACQADWTAYREIAERFGCEARIVNQFLYFSSARAAILPPLGVPLTPVTREMVETARENGQNGTYILLGGDDIEDLNAQLVIAKTPNGGERALLYMKVRADLPFTTKHFSSGHNKVIASLNRKELKYVQVMEKAWKKGVLPVDVEMELGEKLVAAAKSLSTHFSTPDKDGVLKDYVPQYIQEVKASLTLLSQKSDKSEAEKAMLVHYWDVLADLEACLAGAKSGDKSQWKKPKQVNIYEGEYQHEYTVQKPLPADAGGEGLESFPIHGLLEIQSDGVLASIDALRKVGFACQGYRISLDAERGWYAFYYPHAKETSFAQMGSLVIVSPEVERVEDDLVVEAIFRMRQINLTATLASSADAEYLYLARNAWAMGLTKTPKFRKIMSWSDQEGEEAFQKAMELVAKIDFNAFGLELAPEFIAHSILLRTYQIVKLKRRFQLRELVAEHLGVSPEELPKMPNYLQFMDTIAIRSGSPLCSGAVSWTRVDASMPEIQKALKGVYIHHEIMGHDSQMDYIDNLVSIIEDGGVLWATYRRSSLGIYAGHTMSPVADMDTGGAAYLFGYIRNTYKASGVTLVWPAAQVAVRSDIYFYPGDHFGAINPDNERYQASALSTDLTKLAKYIGGEIMLKNAISLYSMPPRWIVTGNEPNRQKVLAAFKQVGVSHLGGLPIEEVVVATVLKKK